MESNAKYLSEVFNLSHFTAGQINLLSQGTAAGKTTLCFNLFKQLPKNAKKLYVCDVKINLEKALKEPNTKEVDVEWIEYIQHKKIEIKDLQEKGIHKTLDEFVQIMFEDYTEVICVMTYEKLGAVLMEVPNLFQYLDLVILDETHNLVEYLNWEKSTIRKNNPYITEARLNAILKISSGKYNLMKVLSECYLYSDLTIIALTATPEMFKVAMENLQGEINLIETDAKLVQFGFEQREEYVNILQEILKLELNQNTKAIIFTLTISHMKQLEHYIHKHTNYKAISLWSIYANEKMDSNQIEVRNQLISQETINEQYNILILNRAYETGINIKDDSVQYMIIHTSRKDLQTQMTGRIRHDAKRVGTLESKTKNAIPIYKGIMIPNKFTNTKLYKQQRDELCEVLSLSRGARLYKWTGLKTILSQPESIWLVDSGRDRNGTWSVIKMRITM